MAVDDGQKRVYRHPIHLTRQHRHRLSHDRRTPIEPVVETTDARESRSSIAEDLVVSVALDDVVQILKVLMFSVVRSVPGWHVSQQTERIFEENREIEGKRMAGGDQEKYWSERKQTEEPRLDDALDQRHRKKQ